MVLFSFCFTYALQCHIITARNEVGARLYFHRHLWFCPRGGMCGCGGHTWLWGVCMVARGHLWLPGGVCGCWGACVVAGGYAWLQGVCVVAGGACMVARGCAWLRGACMVAEGMHGCQRACMVAGGHAWLLGEGVCMVAGWHAWLLGAVHGCKGSMHKARRDTVNERAVRILLECILVCLKYCQPFGNKEYSDKIPLSFTKSVGLAILLQPVTKSLTTLDWIDQFTLAFYNIPGPEIAHNAEP